MQSASNITNSNEYEDVVDKVTVIENNVSTLQSYTVSIGTNFGVGPGVFQELTTGTQNTAIGNAATRGPYKLTTGSGNVMVGDNSGATCENGLNDTFLDTNTKLYPGEQLISDFIALGAGAVISNYNQLKVASNVTTFNISGLTPSTGSGEGTILEFDSSGNITPSAGTCNAISKIDTEPSSLQSSVTTNTSDITTLLSEGTVFTTTGSYVVPSNATTLTIEVMGGGGGGSSGGIVSDSAWAGGGGGGSGALEKITIPVTSRQVIDFTIGVGGAGGAEPTQRGGNGTSTIVIMYGQTLLTANGGLGSTGINGGDGATTSSTGVSCGGGGGMGPVNTSTYGTGGTGTIPGQASTIYETQGRGEKSENGGLNNLGQPPFLDTASGMGGSGLAGYGVGSITSTTTRATNGTYGSGGGAFCGATNQFNGGSGM